MSKARNAFKKIWDHFDFKDMQYERKAVIDAIDELESLKKTPTEKEVCDALNEWFVSVTDHTFTYGVDDFRYSTERNVFYKPMINTSRNLIICYLDDNKCISVREPLPPQLLRLICNFYEKIVEDTLKVEDTL